MTTFFIMGFGYFVAVTALDRSLPGKTLAWSAYWIALFGVVAYLVAWFIMPNSPVPRAAVATSSGV